MGERAVTTFNWTDAHSPVANEHMSATTISRSTLLPNVLLVSQSPLHLNNFCKYLANHPDQAWCSKLLHGIKCSVNIGFEDERMSMVLGNWKSALDHPEVIKEYLASAVAAGCKTGPFTQPPFPDFVGSLMGVVTKKCSFLVKYISYMICPGLHKIPSIIISTQTPSDASMAPLMRQWLLLSSMR